MGEEEDKMILAISGSPREGSNTAGALRYVLEGCEGESKLVELAGLDVRPCNVCDVCKKQMECPIEDDFGGLVDDFLRAKVILVGSPVYFGGVTAQLKALMDRTLPFRRNGFLLENKFGCGVAVGGSRNGGQELTVQAIQAWMLIHGMNVFSDGRPTSHFGGILTAHKAGEVMGDEIGVKTLDGVRDACMRLSGIRVFI